MITNDHDIKPGKAFKLGSRWCLCTEVKFHENLECGGGSTEIRYDWHNGMKIVHDSCDGCDSRIKPITNSAFRAHEMARGNTAWGGHKFWNANPDKPLPKKERPIGVEDIPALIAELQAFYREAELRGAKSTRAYFSQYTSPCGTISRVDMTLCAYK